MRQSLFTLLISIFILSANAQDKTILYKDIKLNGLLFNSTKKDIIKKFGNPQNVFEPNYECGFLSADWQGRKFYSLQYSALLFTGNDVDKYALEHVHFSKGKSLKVSYQGQIISEKTTIKAFESIFKAKVVNNEIYLYFKGADDKLIVTFKKGLLFEIEYWTPC